MKRWVGLGVIADNLINLARASSKKSPADLTTISSTKSPSPAGDLSVELSAPPLSWFIAISQTAGK